MILIVAVSRWNYIKEGPTSIGLAFYTCNHTSPDAKIVADSCLSYHITLSITLLKSFVFVIHIRHDTLSSKAHETIFSGDNRYHSPSILTGTAQKAFECHLFISPFSNRSCLCWFMGFETRLGEVDSQPSISPVKWC